MQHFTMTSNLNATVMDTAVTYPHVGANQHMYTMQYNNCREFLGQIIVK